eukprot:TRINITY_DN11206_c0_g1_i1.p1 TRINITY_DN11206_c0_g1~~TRINITY_DN11206_c0_g1_i1.p1  ORF type:complete len:203 (+),score=55.21 TRINITY_DN11206_c0_g1_i1:37-609(+)
MAVRLTFREFLKTISPDKASTFQSLQANSGSKAFIDSVSRLNARVNELQKMKPDFEVNADEAEPAFDLVRERLNDPSTLEFVNTLENVYKGLVADADASLKVDTTPMFNTLEGKMEKFFEEANRIEDTMRGVLAEAEADLSKLTSERDRLKTEYVSNALMANPAMMRKIDEELYTLKLDREDTLEGAPAV